MLLSNTSEEVSKTGFRCIYDALKMSIHRDAAYLAHPDVFIYRNLNLIHRDGIWILNPDVSPLKSVSQIHRNGPETAKSDVSPQKQVSKYIGDAS